MSADLEFFIDPVCPWCWITSRWVGHVQKVRDYEVTWRFISLKIINEQTVADWYTPDYKAGHMAGLRVLRVADAIRLEYDNDAVGRFYTAIGTRIHVQRRGGAELREKTLELITESLDEVGLPETTIRTTPTCGPRRSSRSVAPARASAPRSSRSTRGPRTRGASSDPSSPRRREERGRWRCGTPSS